MSEHERHNRGGWLGRWSPARRLPSILPRGLRRSLAVALALAAFMLANTLYLLANRLADALGWEFFAVGETTLPDLFQAMVLTHTGVGLLLALLLLGFFLTHLPIVWKRRHRASVLSGILFVTVGLTLVVTGLFILTAAASRDHRWAWWAHVAAAALIPIGYAIHRLVSHARPPRVRARRFAAAVGATALLLAVVHGFTRRDVELTAEARAAFEAGLGSGPGAKARAVTDFTDGIFVPRGFVPPSSPFFPSAATTTTGGYLPSRIITRGALGTSDEEVRREAEEYGFVKDALIGAETCVRCHPDITEQWAASAHRFASFNNPFYEATIDDMRAHATRPNPWVAKHGELFPEETDGIGRIKSKWCSGCHDPAVMLAGQMGLEVDRASIEAQAGLTCLACHAIDTVHNVTGDGNYNIADEQEDPYLFAGAPPGSWRAFLHDAALKAKPTVHKRQMLKPFFGTAEFCATCHKVSLTEPVNTYRWLRGQDEYDNWHDSGVSRNASRTFYLPPTVRVCRDCHMPLEPAPNGDVAAENGMVRSHRFLAVNTALPFVRGDTATIRRIGEFLRDEKLRVDILALRRQGGEPVVMGLDPLHPVLRPGERVQVDVVVRNLGVGHTFPGGTNDSNEGWLEFSLVEETGEVLARSGELLPDGHLDPMAHAYKAVVLDRNGEPIHRRNAQDIHVTAAVNVIGPGSADIGHYAFRVPLGLAGRTLSLRARLLWRKFDRAYTEFAFGANPKGFKGFSAVPDLPVTEIASDQVTLPVAPRSDAGTPDDEFDPDTWAGIDADAWVRFNDYGIGLLREGNTRLAPEAFRRVEVLQPERIDGPLNLARSALQDGNIAAAYEHLERVEAIRPGAARAAWVWGTVLQEDGRYTEAALAYRRVLEDFPHDRATWRNLGRTLYLDQQYEEALEAFEQVLRIDPEDRVAHYHRMLILRALGREAEAKVAAMAYQYHRIDESAQEITREYLLDHPGVNLMAQAIHTHELEPVEARTYAGRPSTPSGDRSPSP